MITDLKNQFMQTAFVTTLWIFGIVTLFAKESSVDVAYVWRVLGAGTIAGLVFGVVYPYVWNYATWPAAQTAVYGDRCPASTRPHRGGDVDASKRPRP